MHQSMARVKVMQFNVTFKNISVISWRSVLTVEETRVPLENHPRVTIHWQTLSHNVVPYAHDRDSPYTNQIYT